MKELYRDPNVPRIVTHVKFTCISAAEMKQLAHCNVTSFNLYTDEQHPKEGGLLDHQMGTTNKKGSCPTCGKDAQTCMGHFGVMDTSVPVYHIGFLPFVVKILQSICKSCSRILLPEKKRAEFLPLCTRPGISYLNKKNLRKEIHGVASKVHRCPHCNALNGAVKKLGLANVIHDVHRYDKKQLANYIDEFEPFINDHRDLEDVIKKGIQLIRPIEAQQLLSRIVAEDLPFLLMDPDSLPQNLLLSRVLVPPNGIRPSVASDFGSGTTEDGLTVALKTALVYSKALELPLKTSDCNSYYEGLTSELARYINADLPSLNTMNKKPTRGLVQRLKGKQGRFRGNLSGKRVNFTSRTVISPDPTLRIDELIVPLHCAKLLTYPERVTPHNIEMLRRLVRAGAYSHPGALYVESNTEDSFKRRLEYPKICERVAKEIRYGDVVERHLHDGDIVLFNRQPSLHRLSIQAFKVLVKPGKTFRFNECCCTPFNADFDGDEMNIHVPQTEEAKAEAVELLASKRNILTPRSGEPLIAAIQDFITGAFLITHKDVFFTRDRFIQIIGSINSGKDVKTEIRIPKPAIMKPVRLWTGKQLFGLIIRPNLDSPVKVNLRTKSKQMYSDGLDLCPNDGYVVIHNSQPLLGTLDKTILGSGSKENLVYILLRDWGMEACSDFLYRLTRTIPTYLTERGFSIGLGDVTPGIGLINAKANLIETGFAKCDEYLASYEKSVLSRQPGCTLEQTLENVTSGELSKIRADAGQACKSELPATNTPLIMANCGSKGSFINISQMTACVGQQIINSKRIPSGFAERTLPHFPRKSRTPAAKGFVANSFYSGLTPSEFFFHTMSGREGLVDTAVKTADSGYMQRRLMKTLEDLCSHYDRTVRNSSGEIIQFIYGSDNLDPMEMETKDSPVNFQRVLDSIRCRLPCPDEEVIIPSALDEFVEGSLQHESFLKLSTVFRDQIRKFMQGVRELIEKWRLHCGLRLDSNLPLDSNHPLLKNKDPLHDVLWQVERLTPTQIREFLLICTKKYNRALVEPGTPVGAICGQSVGEPTTQMTLKTFHFAGVASMNITMGVPRIREIINAAVNITTPIITAHLIDDTSETVARKIKAYIEPTRLGDVTLKIQTVINQDRVYVHIKLDMTRIQLLLLDLDSHKVAQKLSVARLKVKLGAIEVLEDDELLVSPKDRNQLETFSHVLLQVVVKGLDKIKRVLINYENEEKKMRTRPDGTKYPYYVLYIEGNNLREVLATPGIDANRTKSNNIMEVAAVLGIEAARTSVITEMNAVMEDTAVQVDMRHVMLLADLMAYKGQLYGYQRYGMAKLKESVFMLASFENTADHLFESAYHGQTDELSGVSESIILGKPMGLGTGMMKLQAKTAARFPPRPRLFD